MANQINKWLMGRSEPTPRKHGLGPSSYGLLSDEIERLLEPAGGRKR